MMLSSVVLFENYSASYTSFLSVVNEAKPFETLDQLEKSSFMVGAQMGTAYRNMFIVGFFLVLIIISNILFQPIQRPVTETLASSSRWVWENNTGTAIERMERQDYAYMNTLQSIYLELSKHIDQIRNKYKTNQN